MLFSKGRTDDKLRIIFDMCDNDKNGQIDKTELSELLNSLVVIAKTQKLSDKSVNELIDSMFLSAGFKVSIGSLNNNVVCLLTNVIQFLLQEKESLSYDDFKTMMKEFKGDFLAIGLDCKGAKQNYLDGTTNVARYNNIL